MAAFWEASPCRRGLDDLTQDTNSPFALFILGAASPVFLIKLNSAYPFHALENKTLGGMHFLDYGYQLTFANEL
jgi:hypothetical protein